MSTLPERKDFIDYIPPSLTAEEREAVLYDYDEYRKTYGLEHALKASVEEFIKFYGREKGTEADLWIYGKPIYLLIAIWSAVANFKVSNSYAEEAALNSYLTLWNIPRSLFEQVRNAMNYIEDDLNLPELIDNAFAYFATVDTMCFPSEVKKTAEISLIKLQALIYAYVADSFGVNEDGTPIKALS